MLSRNLLIDFTSEIHAFLSVMTKQWMPIFSLQDVLEQVFAALSVDGVAEGELTDVAICLAYDASSEDFRIEAEDIPQGPHREIFNAVMTLGIAIRSRLIDLKAYLPPDGYFPYHFEEVYCDHLVRLTKADFEEFGQPPTLPHIFGAGYRS